MDESHWFRTLSARRLLHYVEQYWDELTARQREDELWLESGVLEPGRRSGYFGYDTMDRIMRWKLEGSYNRFRNARNTVERVEDLTRRAFEALRQSDTAALQVLESGYLDGGIHGVGTSAASAILYWMNPNLGVIIDQHILRATWEDPARVTPTYTEYLVTAPVVRRKREQLDCAMRDLDRALFVRGKALDTQWKREATQR